MKTRRISALVAAVVMVMVPTAFGQDHGAAGQSAVATFEEDLDVNVVTVNVSVVDGDGRPVTGLSADDFTVLVDGEERPLTNFFAAAGGAVEVGPAVGLEPEPPEADEEAAEAEIAPAGPETSHLVLLFDNTSLEKRNRKRVVKALDEFLQVGLDDDTRVMVATTSPAFEILRPFSDDRLRVRAALQQLLDEDATGDVIKSNKRMLERSIVSADTVRGGTGLNVGQFPSVSSSGSGGGTGTSGGPNQADVGDYFQSVGGDGFGEVQTTQFLAQVEALRQQEANRVVMTLQGLDLALRSVAGLPGRKDVVWIGQDLAMLPGINMYRKLYSKFQDWSDRSNMEQPEIWASELELRGQFQAVAGIAQATGATVHVLDASDRDRDAATADMGLSDTQSQLSADPTGPGSSGGYDLSQGRDMIDGSQYLAVATGGGFFGGSRKFDGFFQTLDGLLGGWYSIGYRPAGELDASMHEIEVKVAGEPSWLVRHHQRVANLSPYHRLANRAFSQLLLGEGSNPLGFEVSDAGNEPYEETGKVVQTVRLVSHFDRLVMVSEGESLTADLAVAVVAAEPDGNMSDPKLFRMPIEVSAEQAEVSSASASSFRLVLEPGTQALAIAVRDERSGVVGSVTLPLG